MKKKHDIIEAFYYMTLYRNKVFGINNGIFGDMELNYRYLDFLNEGLVATYPFQKLLNEITQIVGFCHRVETRPYIYEDDKNNYIWIEGGGSFSDNFLRGILRVHVGHKEMFNNQTAYLKRICDACGYYINNIDSNKCEFGIESKIGKDVYEDIKTANDYLYHICPTMYVEKILKTGLVPLSRNEAYLYPNRIYLFTDSILGKEQNYAKMLYVYKPKFYDIFLGDTELYKKYVDNGVNPKEYSVLKIDIEGIDSSIFIDDNFAKTDEICALYVTENIKPKYISVEDNFTITLETIYDQMMR